jgi:hypothetical protein
MARLLYLTNTCFLTTKARAELFGSPRNAHAATWSSLNSFDYLGPLVGTINASPLRNKSFRLRRDIKVELRVDGSFLAVGSFTVPYGAMRNARGDPPKVIFEILAAVYLGRESTPMTNAHMRQQPLDAGARAREDGPGGSLMERARRDSVANMSFDFSDRASRVNRTSTRSQAPTDWGLI